MAGSHNRPNCTRREKEEHAGWKQVRLILRAPTPQGADHPQSLPPVLQKSVCCYVFTFSCPKCQPSNKTELLRHSGHPESLPSCASGLESRSWMATSSAAFLVAQVSWSAWLRPSKNFAQKRIWAWLAAKVLEVDFGRRLSC